MIVVVTLILLAAVLLFVGFPLVSGRNEVTPRATPTDEQAEQLLAEREHTLDALRDLQFEHAIGNLSSTDFDALRAIQRRKAVTILSALERLGDEASNAPEGLTSASRSDAGDPARAALEAEIAEARRGLETARAAEYAPNHVERDT